MACVGSSQHSRVATVLYCTVLYSTPHGGSCTHAPCPLLADQLVQEVGVATGADAIRREVGAPVCPAHVANLVHQRRGSTHARTRTGTGTGPHTTPRRRHNTQTAQVFARSLARAVLCCAVLCYSHHTRCTALHVSGLVLRQVGVVQGVVAEVGREREARGLHVVYV